LLRIRRLNDAFIHAQQTLGIKITTPRNGDVLPTGECKIAGTFINPPGSDVIAMTYVEPVEVLGFDGGWWSQSPLVMVPDADREWEATVQFGVGMRSHSGPSLFMGPVKASAAFGKPLRAATVRERTGTPLQHSRSLTVAAQ
jgi:hypothetical protein